MSHSLAWPADWTPVLILLLGSVCYVAFHYGFHAERTGRRGRQSDGSVPGMDRTRAVYRQRLGGFFCLGVVPAVACFLLPYGARDIGLGLERPGAAALFVVGLMALLGPLLLAVSRKADFTEHYPQIRVIPWDRALYVKNAASWALYHSAYEFFFRGFLLFPLVPWAGAWGAIAITTLAYVFSHLEKHPYETASTLPLGVILAAAALYTGGFWAPFVAHVLIANTAEILAVKRRSAEFDALQ